MGFAAWRGRADSPQPTRKMNTLSQYQRLPCVRPRISAMRWLAYFLLLGLGLLTLAALAMTSYLRLGSDTAALRDAARATSRAEWRKVVALNIGEATFLLARAGLSFAKIPDEPRVALSSIRACEVGVYAACNSGSADRASMLARADQAMNCRGWERIVGVLDRENLVAVYVPRKMASPKTVRACVLVLDGRQLVVVSAKGNLEPVIQLALKRANFRERIPLLAKR